MNVSGQSVDAVAIYVGGRTGPQAKAAQPIMEMVPCDEALPDVLSTIVKHLDLFKRVEPQPGVKDRVLMVPACAVEDTDSLATADRPADPDGEIVPAPVSGLPEADQARGSLEGLGRPVAGQTGGGTMTGARTIKIKACEARELGVGSGTLVTVGGKAVALFRVGERVVAVDAECPHEGGPLQEGTIEDGCVVCPWHNYKFELDSGRCELDPSLRLGTYPATIEEDVVMVEVPG